MYAIVDIAGQQFKVEKNQKIYVNRLEGEAGSKVDFDKVLLIEDDGKVQVGMPVLNNFIVSASIVSHVKGDKVKVFKKKKRKGYQVLNGHRQALTELLIDSIGEGKPKAAVALKKETETKAKVSEKPIAEKVTEKESAIEKKTTATKSKPEAIKTEKPAAAKKTGTAKASSAAAKTKKPAAKTTQKKEIKTATKAAPKAKKVTATKEKTATKSKKEEKK